MMNIEKERIAEVRKYLSLDLTKLTELQDIVDLAAKLCNKPVAIITLLDEKINWLRVRSGVEVDAMPRDTSFCQFCIAGDGDDMLIIRDASKDDRFNSNPLVHSEPNLRFYAGTPLLLHNGFKLGTLCLFDLKPSSIAVLQQKALKTLGKQVTFILEREQGEVQLKKQLAEIQSKNEALVRIAYIQSHDIRQPLTSIMGLVSLIKDKVQPVDENWLRMIAEATTNLDDKIKAIVRESTPDGDLKVLRFNKTIEEIEDYAILLLDKNGNIENWNKGAQSLKGYDAGEIIGKNFCVFFTPEEQQRKRPERLIAHAIKHGVARDTGWRVRKDGTKFWGSIVITAIHNNLREIIGFTKVTKNLT